MRVETYSLTIDDMIENANLVKENLLIALEREKILAEGQAREIANEYAVVLHKKNTLGRFLAEKIFGREKEPNVNELRITIVKVVETIPPPKENGETEDASNTDKS